jgi:uncharacterized protein
LAARVGEVTCRTLAGLGPLDDRGEASGGAYDAAVMSIVSTLDETELAAEVCRRHGAHTVLLYGSRARGAAVESSDVDLIAIRASGGTVRDVEPWRGFSIDLFVYDEAGVSAVVVSHAPNWRDARPLVQRDGWGDRVVGQVKATLAGPRPAMAAGDLAALWAWGEKMRGRIRHADPTLAAFHRAVLIVESPQSWAEVRGRWFFGPKATIAALPGEDPSMHAAFAGAVRPNASLDAFDCLLDAVFDPRLRPAAARGPVS